MIGRFLFSDSEIEQLLKSMIIVCDTREQENNHILDYFSRKGINHISKKIDAGDYTAIIPKNETLGIFRDIQIPIVIERKNSIDELASSFKDRLRFESEFIRAAKNNFKILLLVEDGQGYKNILNGNYKSQYEPKALLGSLKAFECRYNFITAFVDKPFSGNWIYYTLLYHTRESLKK